MPLSQAEKDELEEIANRFVGAFVKCGASPAKWAVYGLPCSSIEEAVDQCLIRCSTAQTKTQDRDEVRGFLRSILREAILKLPC